MIKGNSSTKRRPTRQENVWQQAQRVGRLKVRITDRHLEAANIPAGYVCLVHVDAPAILGELAAVRFADGRFDVAFLGEGNSRRFCLISADGKHRQVSSRECRVIGRVVSAYAPQLPTLKIDI